MTPGLGRLSRASYRCPVARGREPRASKRPGPSDPYPIREAPPPWPRPAGERTARRALVETGRGDGRPCQRPPILCPVPPLLADREFGCLRVEVRRADERADAVVIEAPDDQASGRRCSARPCRPRKRDRNYLLLGGEVAGARSPAAGNRMGCIRRPTPSKRACLARRKFHVFARTCQHASLGRHSS